ncbi:hypothetical protein COO91_02589 [Nostoc flagelliforme CCNUN1]|uniref:Uncharacterized protein n=1 Tax=Nostoc flagelliforme CCNUN1 TaxID=2038116 RepID=A0A2K8SMN4_9NOSO|nr:hypothetical protein COO91_02589 [Nostoc flagelliforme CCNUN1]
MIAVSVKDLTLRQSYVTTPTETHHLLVVGDSDSQWTN